MIGRRFAGAVLMAVVAAGCALLPGPEVRIDDGLAPRLTPDRVSALVIEQIHAMEAIVGHVKKPARIISLTATTAVGVAELEPGSGQGRPTTAGIQWLVRAEGTFTNNRTPPGVEPMIATTGYVVISDTDGSVVGLGFP